MGIGSADTSRLPKGEFRMDMYLIYLQITKPGSNTVKFCTNRGGIITL
jgi:hypothetical protein